MKHAHLSLATGVATLATLLASGPAYAAGVSAGTLIQNTASASYTSGPSSGTVQSNTVTVKVDELLNVAVASLTASPVSAGNSTAVLAWSVTNTGNGPEAFDIAIDPAVAGNGFNTTVTTIAVDTNNNGVYDPGVDQVLTAGAATPSIPADGSLKLLAVVTLPSTATDGQSSQVRLTATAVTGSGTPGTSFAGQGDGGGDAVVGLTGATSNALDSLVASLATVSLAKSATILDPFGGTKPVPGAVVTYSLVASVSGSGTTDSLHVTDAIPTGTTYQPGTLTLNAATLTDASDADAGTASGSGIDVNLGSVAGGTTKTVTFKVKIN